MFDFLKFLIRGEEGRGCLIFDLLVLLSPSSKLIAIFFRLITTTIFNAPRGL